MGMDDEGGASDTIYLLRTMQQHHVQLSSMADQKANILIGATLVLFALIVREGATLGMSWPLMILATTSFVAAALCVLAVIPSIGTPKRAGAPNMLFFGTFADQNEAGFRAAMAPIMHDNASIHAAMLRDIHQLGCVLKHKKYKYLAWGYRVFIAGLAVTLVAYGAEQLIA